MTDWVNNRRTLPAAVFLQDYTSIEILIRWFAITHIKKLGLFIHLMLMEWWISSWVPNNFLTINLPTAPVPAWGDLQLLIEKLSPFPYLVWVFISICFPHSPCACLGASLATKASQALLRSAPFPVMGFTQVFLLNGTRQTMINHNKNMKTDLTPRRFADLCWQNDCMENLPLWQSFS